MTVEITVAVLSLTGTAIGSLGGILAANKLTTYRIGKLEEKVDKHNSMIERMYRVEGEITRIEEKFDEKLAVTNHRIKDLEHGGETS